MKTIIYGNLEGGSCALRAVTWLMSCPESQRDAILTYGKDWSVYVRRNKNSISAWIQDERK